MGFEYDSRSEVIWLTKQDRLPDVCCSCGMFTDHRVAVKHVEKVTQSAKANPGCLMVLVTLFMHVALGPLGWLLSVLLEGDSEKETTKTVKKKSKVKISQCQMCHATEPVEIVETRGGSFSFLVHPGFRVRWMELNREDST